MIKEYILNTLKFREINRKKDILIKQLMKAEKLLNKSFKRKNMAIDITTKETIVIELLKDNVLTYIEQYKDDIKIHSYKENEFWGWVNDLNETEITDMKTAFKVFTLSKEIIGNIQNVGIFLGFGLIESIVLLAMFLVLAYIIPILI